MLLLQIPLHCVDTDLFTTLLTQVLQEEEICCHKTLAKFQWPGFFVADVFTTLLQTQILQEEEICCESVWTELERIERVMQSKQAHRQHSGKKQHLPPSLPCSLPPSSHSQAPSYQSDNSKKQYDLDTTSSWMRKVGCGFFLVEEDSRMG
jgi:hypothetical protein